jgi:hypothetical protein
MSEEFENYLRIYIPKDLTNISGGGWDLEAVLDQLNEAVEAARTGKDGEVYQMTVEVPAGLATEELNQFFEAIATAAHDFEERFPQRTWDVFVAGGVLSEGHSAEAAFRRVFDENERLREQEKDWRAALVLALGLEENAPLPEMDELIGRAAVVRAGAERLRSDFDLAEKRLEALRAEFRKGLGR